MSSRPAASTPHLVWAGGHFITLLSGLWALKALLYFWSPSTVPYHSYKLAYLGALISYGIVVYKSSGTPQLSKSYLQRLSLDENVQYLLLSLFWFWTKPITVTLVPFVVFSLFHVLTFVRTTLIPHAFPAPAGTQTVPKRLSTRIQAWVKLNYDPSMRLVAFAEIFIFLRLLGGAIILRNSLFAPLFYAHFLRLRFYLSAFSRLAILKVTDELDKATRDPRCPEPVRKAYSTLHDLVARYASLGSFPGQGPVPPSTASTTTTTPTAQQPATSTATPATAAATSGTTATGTATGTTTGVNPTATTATQ